MLAPPRRLVALTSIVVTLAFAVGIGSALGRDARVSSSVTIERTAPRAAGHVSSRLGACERNRKVDVMLDIEGPGRSILFGTAHTNARGGWALDRMLADARFYAVARPKPVVTREHERICRQARSIRVHG
jgi:hypothetical protein